MEYVSTQRRIEATRLVIIGGGPGGYEAAIGAAQLGANVTIVERAGMGGSAVLTDVVPSKTLIATADVVRRAKHSSSFGVMIEGLDNAETDFAVVNHRLLDLAKEQSADIRNGLERAGVRIIIGEGRLLDAHTVEVNRPDGSTETLDADAVLLATGAHPRELPTAKPDGERIFNWTQIYNMNEVPEHLIVIGSGVTGAEFASAYNLLGAKVTLVSSRDRVLPGEDADAAGVLEDVFKRNGLNVVSQARAEAVTRDGDKVLVTLADGRILEGSHCLVAVGSIPNTKGLGLEEAGVQLTESGHIKVDGVSRTTANNVYAAGDCTGIFALASVAAMQGRIAVAHLLGDSVKPINLNLVSSNIFTSPEIATVGVSQRAVAEGKYQANIVKVDLATNARAKMMNMEEGFVKIVSRKGSGTVIGGVVVAPRASELIYSLALAVQNNLHVDDVAETFTVYPSLAGSLAEAARRLHRHM
ncbi:NAD(P)H-quinone dehydrogenase [Glutamicibacter sp. MNS18]|uniref:NAD(P)H-quinone dehydrogenase n=1 Tax=Glutamicibacter sp. MNS18 TaxID=2989817 RepID=UPI0022367F45|nr:NAD(P)H-quinone dehydrogenase [Glutamicibacter sp. MNS18]MCW4465136.1 NAD(P)H-quinone dehydrogenase [Glutamicibacter sp. MNS18]